MTTDVQVTRVVPRKSVDVRIEDTTRRPGLRRESAASSNDRSLVPAVADRRLVNSQ